MTITHQTILGEDEEPSADEQVAMREAERDRIEGNDWAFESHAAVKSRLGIA